MSSTVDSHQLCVADFQISPRRRHRESVVRVGLLASALVSVAISGGIVFSLIGETWTFVTGVEFSSLISTGWFPRDGDFDLRTLFLGSLIVGGVAMVLATPIGLASAIYLSEYASPRVRRFIKPVLEVLAGIPSVVLGFFALTFISPEIIQRVFSETTPQSNMAVAGIGVGILVIPLMASISEDAMSAVPDSLREASYGLGARRVTTTIRVVLPAAVSGLVAAFIVAISRAIGETMVVYIAAGGGNGAFLETDPLQPGLTMTAAIATQASGTDNVQGVGLTFQSLFFVGFLLFVVTMLLNLVANGFVRRVRQRY